MNKRIQLVNMSIAEIIIDLGADAGLVIDKYLCKESEISVVAKGRCSCPGTSLKLGYAAKIMGKEARLHELVEALMELQASKEAEGIIVA